MEILFYFYKLIPQLIKPLQISIILLCFSLYYFRRSARTSITTICLSIAILAVSSLPRTASFVLYSLESQHPPKPLTEIPEADAVILLTGGMQTAIPPRINAELGSRGDRLRLTHLLLSEKKSKLLIISGGSQKPSLIANSEADETEKLLQDWGLNDLKVIKETESKNTKESFTALADLLSFHEIQHALIVTSAYHMPRSMFLARHYLSNITITPVSANTLISHEPSYSTIHEYIPSSVALSGTSLGIHEYIGIVAYKILFYFDS